MIQGDMYCYLVLVQSRVKYSNGARLDNFRLCLKMVTSYTQYRRYYTIIQFQVRACIDLTLHCLQGRQSGHRKAYPSR